MGAETLDRAAFIHRVEVPPPEATEAGVPTRALLLLHGTGGNEHDLLPLGRAVAPDAVLISPRGRVLEAGMPRFFRRLAEGVFDEADVAAQAADLAAFARDAASRHAPGLELTALGFSNGANIAAALMLLHPGVLDAAVLLRPMVPLVPPVLPDLAGRRVLALNGMADPIATPAIAERLVALLRAAGATVEARMLPAGHGLTQADMDAAAAFLRAAP
jgi:phospholipase/carboxylesterase